MHIYNNQFTRHFFFTATYILVVSFEAISKKINTKQSFGSFMVIYFRIIVVVVFFPLDHHLPSHSHSHEHKQQLHTSCKELWGPQLHSCRSVEKQITLSSSHRDHQLKKSDLKEHKQSAKEKKNPKKFLICCVCERRTMSKSRNQYENPLVHRYVPTYVVFDLSIYEKY